MGVCPSFDPQVRVLQSHNQSLKQILNSELKDLRIYNFYTPILTAISRLPTRYMYNEGILEDINKLVFYSERKGITSLESRSSLFGENLFDEQLKNSCLIIENEIVSEAQSKEFQCPKKDFDEDKDQTEEQGRINPNFQGTQSFQNNLSKNESLVAQMNILYGRQIKRQEYSQALKLFLKWVQYFNEHSYGGFLKTIYKAFSQSLYRLEKNQFETLVDQVSIFVQYMVKVYTKIYHLQQLNKSLDGKLFKNENVYNLIMSFMFRRTKIKSFIRIMVKESNHDKIKKFQEKLKLYGKKNIGHFGIDNRFILIRNEEWQKVLKKQTSQNTWSTKNHNQNSGQKHHSNQQQNQSTQKLLESFQSHLDSNCYQKSLRLMSQLSSMNQAISPISKLKTIISIAKSIQQEIHEFYLKQLKLNKGQIPDLDPDNLTAIVMYLIVSNNNVNLLEQLKMIEYFTTTNTLNCISGYYLNVFIAAIQMVVELKI